MDRQMKDPRPLRDDGVPRGAVKSARHQDGRGGDRGRDLVLCLGRKVCGLKLNELAREAGLSEYASVAVAVKRYETYRRRDPVEHERFKQVVGLLTVKTPVVPQRVGPRITQMDANLNTRIGRGVP